MKITTRLEREADYQAVRLLNQRAFGSLEEADIVEALRAEGAAVVSMVAEINGELAGHIMFSPVTLEGAPDSLRMAGLGPMAVAPSFQRKGVGSALAEEGLKACKNAGYDAIFVLGHPEYYPRFGFVKASRFGVRCQYDAPDEAFMALELRAGSLAGLSGTVKYHKAFGG